LRSTASNYDCDQSLHIQIINGLTRTTHYDYDNRNRQTKVTDVNGGETEYVYYKDGKTASIKDAVGNKTEYTTPVKVTKASRVRM
jgi:YD repeat-containing protein